MTPLAFTAILRKQYVTNLPHAYVVPCMQSSYTICSTVYVIAIKCRS